MLLQNRSNNTMLILVTGATGKTGAYVVEELIQRGFRTRAFVHRLDQRAEALRSRGAEVVVGDLLNVEDVRAAVNGVDGAYFCYPPADRLLEATVNFALEAKAASLKTVVNLSQFHAREGHASPLTRQHWLGEKILDMADVGTTHLRATFFADGYLTVAAHTIAVEGRFYLPFGTGKTALVTCEDVARVAAGVFENPEMYVGKVYLVTGSRLMSQEEVAGEFSSELQKPVAYIDTPIEQWQQMAEYAGFSPFLIEHFSRAAEDYRRGHFEGVTTVVKDIGGGPPASFTDFVRKHADCFGGQVAGLTSLTTAAP